MLFLYLTQLGNCIHQLIYICFVCSQLFCGISSIFVSKTELTCWKYFLQIITRDLIVKEIKAGFRGVCQSLFSKKENECTCINLPQHSLGKCSSVIFKISSLSKIVSNIISISSMNRSFNQFISIRAPSA